MLFKYKGCEVTFWQTSLEQFTEIFILARVSGLNETLGSSGRSALYHNYPDAKTNLPVVLSAIENGRFEAKVSPRIIIQACIFLREQKKGLCTFYNWWQIEHCIFVTHAFGAKLLLPMAFLSPGKQFHHVFRKQIGSIV